MVKRKKQPWPTKEAMEQVYELNLWGGKEFDFYSGEGSHHPELVIPYVEKVSTFLQSFEKPLSVCDLGCGDFNVGKQLFPFTKSYIAVDIVEPLIQRNKQIFKDSRLNFICADIAKDPLPKTDCVLLRQVLQHLSNTEIQAIVHKLKNYSYLILTEHIPAGDFEPNKDIISGQGIRIKKKSGVNLLENPFNLKVEDKIEILRMCLSRNKGLVVTTFYKL